MKKNHKIFISHSTKDSEQTSMKFGRGHACLYIEKNQQSNRVNQDSLAMIAYGKEQGVLVISDGAGGHPAGDKASNMAVSGILDSIKKTPSGLESLRGPILDGIEKANQLVLNLGVGAACTLSVVEINDKQVRTYHIGDSSILVCGSRGKIKLQTVDHSPVGYALEAGVLNVEEAMSHEERHLLTNALGSQDMRIVVGPQLKMRPSDTLILASDGLWDNLEINEVVQLIRKGSLINNIKQLVDQCHLHMQQPQNHSYSKNDDFSMILWRPD